MNGTMISPQTLSCQRQRATFLVPSLLFRHQSTFLRRRRPGVWSRAGPTRRHIPGSPSLLPTSPASLSLILPTRTSSKEEAAKMEKKIRRMLTPSGVPGCSPRAAFVRCQRASTSTPHLLKWNRERLRRQKGASAGLRAPSPRPEAGLGRRGLVRCGVLPCSCALRPLSPLQVLTLRCPWGAPTPLRCAGDCRLRVVPGCPAGCCLSPHLYAGAQRTHNGNWHQ